ncbi:MAG: ATP-binding cassette domain-containing protein [Pseudonocardiaceae bacterium]|nr:ATP-binding cassette domain-containing protein [Pseudonocardiaceae bacterium]
MSAALPVADPRVTVRRIWALFRSRLPLAVLAALVMIAAGVAGVVTPIVIGWLIDDVTAGTGTTLVTWCGLLLALAGGGAILTLVAELLVARCGEPVVARLREQTLGRALAFEPGKMAAAGSGDLLARLGSDVRALSNVVRAVLVEFTGAGLTVVLTLAGMAVVDPRLGLAGLCAVPIQIWATKRYLRTAPDVFARAARVRGAHSQEVLDSVSGAATVRSLRLGPMRLDRIEAGARDIRNLHLLEVRLQTRFTQRLNAAELVGTTAILLIGFALVRTEQVSVGAATAAALMFLRLFDPINVVLGLVDDVLEAYAGLRRLVGVIETPVEERPSDGPCPADGAVSVDDVRFAYQPGHDVVCGVDLKLGSGERLALVGASGAGKSTLASLIAGLHAPGTGVVRIGGVSLDRLSPAQRHRTVIVVAQASHVFRGRLRDDLALASPDAGDDRFGEALALVGAQAWIEALPSGLDTVVGTGGHELTPVQVQQLALARLVLADPVVAVLDEATAEADSEGARLVEDGVDAVTAGRTAIIVAHRLSQAVRCDRVAVMESGRIVELGTHEDLVTAGGAYAALWKAWSAR